MSLAPKKRFQWNYILLAFLAPILGMFCVMLVRGFIPFGATSMLYSDMYHQYYPFFVEFRDTLLSGDSLLHSWSVGMGMDYLGLISYYLASPLNLLSILVPEDLLLHYFSILSPIKLGFAGMFFAIFLKKLFKKNDLSLVLFGSFYALCAWALGYQWNVMWLDTFALLPLVALGTVSLLKSGRFLLYVVSLFFAVLANYYIGFFVCIFVAMIFLCYEICRWQGFKKFFYDLSNMLIFSLLAIGLTAILELPAYAALQNTQSSINTFPEGFKLNIADENTWAGLWDAMRQVAGNMNGALIPTFKEGLPNLYCGVITNILALLYLTCTQVKFRDKLCSVLLLLFFSVSFILRQLDYIWHGFHFTNMIPYRFSFLYSFVMLYMAYRAYLLRLKVRRWQIFVVLVPAVGIMFCANDRSDLVYWVYNGLFLLLYAVVLVYPLFLRPPAKFQRIGAPEEALSPTESVAIEKSPRNNRRSMQSYRYHKQVSTWLLLGIMLLELILTLVNFGVAFTGTIVKNYPSGTDDAKAVLEYMEAREQDNLFYRAETTHSQTLNDGALNGYNGISTFTSSANVKVTRFMKTLGYGAKDTYNRYCFEESSPVSNLFLNLKYMLERQGKVEENPYFDDVFQQGSVHLLENNAYLPLGFLANNDLVNVNFATGANTFEFQNKLFRAATGVDGNVWTLMTGESLSITGYGVTVTTQTGSGYSAYIAGSEAGGTVVYQYVVDREGFVCTALNLAKKNKYTFLKNGTELYSETYSIPQSLSLCQVRPGDVIEVHLVCNAGEKGNITLQTALLDETLFRQGYDVLKASTLQLTQFSNTRVEGTIQCDRNGVLYTSIPQDGNWTATVDGQPVQTILVGGAMVGVLLSEGQHTVRFVYENSSFSLGWKVTLCCSILLLALYLIRYRPKLKRGKFE